MLCAFVIVIKFLKNYLVLVIALLKLKPNKNFVRGISEHICGNVRLQGLFYFTKKFPCLPHLIAIAVQKKQLRY